MNRGIMRKAGFCTTCQSNVWLNEDGTCLNGHPSTDITNVYGVDEVLPQSPVAGASSPKAPGRKALIVGGAVVLLVLLGACALSAVVLPKLVGKGSEIAAEWKDRLGEDYPGWRSVGFNARSFSGDGGTETEYSISMIPPDRDFSIGIIYRSRDGGSPVCEDFILRPGAKHNDRADALLDFIEKEYIAKDQGVTAVTSYSDGSATVTWQKVNKVGSFSSRIGSFDKLSYDEGTGTWSVTDRAGY